MPAVRTGPFSVTQAVAGAMWSLSESVPGVWCTCGRGRLPTRDRLQVMWSGVVCMFFDCMVCVHLVCAIATNCRCACTKAFGAGLHGRVAHTLSLFLPLLLCLCA